MLCVQHDMCVVGLDENGGVCACYFDAVVLYILGLGNNSILLVIAIEWFCFVMT